TLRWELDKTKASTIPFLGFEGDYKASEISGKPRLFYDETKPFNREIPYYLHYKPISEVVIPEAYIIPKSWWNVLELLKINNIKMSPLESDSEIEVESYRIINYETSKHAYEGHYPH